VFAGPIWIPRRLIVRLLSAGIRWETRPSANVSRAGGRAWPVAVVQDWVEEETDRSTTNYDAISERLQAEDQPPAGLLVHTAGFTGNGFRIFEVWESREDYERFVESA